MGVQIQGDTGNVIATKGTYSGNVTIGGTLTYEDVTNIDSVGLITARQGIEVGARPGVAASISVDGNAVFSGIVTAASFSGIDLGAVTGATGDFSIADKIVHTGDTNTAIRFPAADIISFENAGSETARFSATNQLSVNTTADITGVNVAIGGSVRLVNPTGQSATISALPSGTYNTGVSGGSAIVFHRFSDAGGGSDEIAFETHHQGTRHGEAARFNKSGNLVFPSGQGIDFSATGDGTGTKSSELFDDYEEGTWVPDARDGSLSYSDANYTKIGRMVYVSAYVHSFTDTSTNDQVTIQGLPFNVGVGGVTGGSVMYQYVTQAHACTVYIATTGLKFYGGHTGNYDGVRYNELSGSHSFYLHAWYIN